MEILHHFHCRRHVPLRLSAQWVSSVLFLRHLEQKRKWKQLKPDDAPPLLCGRQSVCLSRTAGWSEPSVRRWAWRGTGVRLRPKPWRTNCSFTSRARRSPAGETAGWRRRTELREPPCTSDQRRVSLRVTVTLLNTSWPLRCVNLCFNRFERMKVEKQSDAESEQKQQTGLWVPATLRHIRKL